MISPFHLAFPVDDLSAARAFYVGVLGCREGRSAATWVDFDLFGHQLSAHLKAGKSEPAAWDGVDGVQAPIPHFGVILAMADWKALAERLQAAAGVRWVLRPQVRFPGAPGEQATLFVLDPAGNALEFKAFADAGQVFATSR